MIRCSQQQQNRHKILRGGKGIDTDKN
ncbi:hypothetical protein IM043_gp227 [Bacillus phage SPG24]|nr:hypothetical protein IM043_gp227 [Bacillus phage SPG24]